MKYAKAYAGALTVLVAFVAGKYGLELDDEVTGAITVLLTPAVVALVPNKEAPPEQKAPHSRDTTLDWSSPAKDEK